jgi:hypothetical protein
MVPQATNHAPEQKTRRERRMEILAERRRIKQIVKKLRPVTFDNNTVTEAGNFQFLARFKELIGLDALIEDHFHLEQKANCVYPSSKLVDHLLDCALLGHTRFSHMNALQSDPGYQIVTGIDRFPDESTFRGFLSKLSWSHLIQLVALNRDLLARHARMGEKRLVWIDIDDTVITLFGEQEGATNGYNPRYHGRPSYKIRVAFIAGSGELIHLQVNPGNTNGMKDLLSFVKEIEAMLPPEWIIEGIRADCGFADDAVMAYAEERGWQYIFKLPKKATVKKAISYLQQHPAFWETLAEKQEDITFATEDDRWAAADIPILLTNWEKARRCVIYREAHETERTTDDELKEGYAVEQNSQHSLLRNLLFSWIKAIAYNVMVWFKQTLMPESLNRCEVQTIRRSVIRVPANVVGSGRYQHIRLAPNPTLAGIVDTMQHKLRALAERFILVQPVA